MRIVYESNAMIYFSIKPPKDKLKALRDAFEPVTVASGETIVVTEDKEKLEALLGVTLKQEVKK